MTALDALATTGIRLVIDADLLEQYRWDRTTWLEPGRPLAAAFPTTAAQVGDALAWASRNGVPVVPRGAGSSLAGGAQAIDGSLVVSLERMTRIIDVDERQHTVDVEPGVITADVSAAVAHLGLWYPPDPASKAFCTIGGNVATNAGGLCCVKYGVTRDYVLGVELALADGTLVELGRRTRKGVAGLDLTSLVVGSEGTLGIVTRATLRLRPLPPPASTLVSYFPSLTAAGEAVTALASGSGDLSMLEIIDQPTLRAIESWRRMELDGDAAALLLAQIDAPGAARADLIRQAAAACDRAGSTFTAWTDDPEEGDALLEARRLAYPSLERLGMTILDDVAVPLPAIPALLAGVEAIAAEHGLVIGTFGHAGDGNMHPTIVVPHGDAGARSAAIEAFAGIVRLAMRLGGTITGEHGVGRLKTEFLQDELDAGARRLQQAVKAVFDPRNVLNPERAL